MLFWRQVDHFNAIVVELMGFWVARDIVQYQQNFKRQSHTRKVLFDFRDKGDGTNPEKRFYMSRPSNCGTIKRLTASVYLFSSISSFIDKGSADHYHLHKIESVYPFLP